MATWRRPIGTTASVAPSTTSGCVATRSTGSRAYGTPRVVLTRARTPRGPRSSARSSTCASTITSGPADCDPLRRLRVREAPFRRRSDPDRQRDGVRVAVPLPRARCRRWPRLHQARDPETQRQGRALSQDRRRGVLPDAGRVVIDDTELFNDRLKEWEDFYNFDRPHGALGGQTPYERLRQKTARPVSRTARSGPAARGVAALAHVPRAALRVQRVPLAVFAAVLLSAFDLASASWVRTVHEVSFSCHSFCSRRIRWSEHNSAGQSGLTRTAPHRTFTSGPRRPKRDRSREPSGLEP